MRETLKMIAVLLAAAPAGATVPLMLYQQGRILGNDDQPLNGAASVTIELYDTDSPSATPIWDETYNVVAVSGVYDLLIGGPGGEALDLADFTGSATLWMGVKVNGDTLQPRLRLASTAFAFAAIRAGSAASADALAGSAFAGTGEAATAARSDHTHPYAAAAHGHALSEVTGAAAASHTHAAGDLDLSSRALLQHTHGAADLNLAGATLPAHTHTIADLGGTGSELPTDLFSAYDDLVAEGAIGAGSGQVAAGNHGHSTLSVTNLTATNLTATNLVATNLVLGSTAVSGACSTAGQIAFHPTYRNVWYCDGTSWYPIYPLPGTAERPGLSCKQILAGGGSHGSGLYPIAQSSGTVQVYCDMTTDGGGWTRVFNNALTSDLSGMTFTRAGSACSTNVQKVTASGFWGGHGNAGNNLNVAGMGAVEWTLDLASPVVISDATEVRQTGTMQNHSDYDYTGTSALITASPFVANGEFAAQYFDGANWQWYIFYQCAVGASCPHDLRKATTSVKSPYVRWGFQHGGPNDCDAANSDGFYIRDWAVWVR